jgi:HEAT repeat protein
VQKNDMPPASAPPDAAAPAPPPESATTLFKQFAVYPFFIVLGIVAVFTLFGLLLRDEKTETDYLHSIRTASGDERWYAAFQLSKVLDKRGEELRGDPKFLHEVTTLFEAANGGDPRVQRYLAIVLGRVGDLSSVPSLSTAMRDDDDTETRVWAAWALGKIAVPAVVPALIAALEDADPAVRKMAAYALGTLHDERALQPLLDAFDDPVEDVRWNLAIALAQQGDASGYPILQQMVNAVYLSRIDGMTDERMKDVMMNAVKALGTLQATSPSARDLLAETARSAPYPLVQHEAKTRLEAAQQGHK